MKKWKHYYQLLCAKLIIKGDRTLAWLKITNNLIEVMCV